MEEKKRIPRMGWLLTPSHSRWSATYEVADNHSFSVKACEPGGQAARSYGVTFLQTQMQLNEY